MLTLSLPLGLLLLFVAIVGLGTSGTQTLIYGFVANYFTTKVRGAAVAWCAGFGRLGGVGGPLLGGFLVAAGLALNSIFYVLAALALLGTILTLLVPTRRTPDAAFACRSSPRPRPSQGVAAAGTRSTDGLTTTTESGRRCTTGSSWRSTHHRTRPTTHSTGPPSSPR